MILYDKVEANIDSVEVLGKMLDYEFEHYIGTYPNSDDHEYELNFTNWNCYPHKRYGIWMSIKNQRIYDIWVFKNENITKMEDLENPQNVYGKKRPTKLQILEAVKVISELLE